MSAAATTGADRAAAFEAELARDGYVEIARRAYPAGHSNGEHGHHFTARGLVLEGEFIITMGGERRSYLPGDVFSVKEDTLHAEDVGPNGVSLLVGRKY